VTTTPATTSDFAVLPTIQDQLSARDLLPGEQIVDCGYMTADHLLTSQSEHGIDLVGPVAPDRSWQARADDGFAAAHFALDWDAQRATCPQGATSVQWLARQDRHGNAAIQIRFAKADCAGCAVRGRCVQSPTEPRVLQVRDRDHYAALQAARQRQRTEVFKTRYAQRAGIEGTIAQGIGMGDLRRSRYIGAAKTRLMHLLLAAALNFMRVAAWLADIPRSRTRPSAFAALSPGLQSIATG
jgi:transposase